MIGMKNKRLKYLLLTLFVVMLGLLSRKMSACTLDFVKLFVNMRKRVACVLALVFSYLIEISQLYHAPWIDAIRATALGGLVLGFGFLWSDILCYTVGVLLGIIVDGLLGWSRK